MYTVFRKAEKRDVSSIRKLIVELAEFEKAPDQVKITEMQLEEDGFSATAFYQAFIAEIDGEVVGFSLSFVRYSTWRGKMLYMEDLYVTESHRGKSIGSGLLEKQLEYAKESGINFLCFQVLDWNQPAISFYKKYDVAYDPEWINGIIPVR
ncbi:MAG TPA: GNAT family N-acetyltransferase [Catalimonadaceae bacterium]|nr:GNAT family N-acetyltransferase [Catalimonadaceae bacterium]